MDRYSYPYDPGLVKQQEGKVGAISKSSVASKSGSTRDGHQDGGATSDPREIEKQLKRLESELKTAGQIPMGGAHVNWREQRILKKQEASIRIEDGTSGGMRRFECSPLPDEARKFLSRRDFAGALTVLKFHQDHKHADNVNFLPWMGYVAFHQGNFEQALEFFRRVDTDTRADDVGVLVFNQLNIACCLFHLERFDEAKVLLTNDEVVCPSWSSSELAKTDEIMNRLLFQLAQRVGDEEMLMTHHQKLVGTSVEDQMSLAAMHFLRGHFQEATTVYKRLLMVDREARTALNIYLALCYYKLDYYDVSMELLDVYLVAYPDSIVARNLKACNLFRLYNGKVAEKEVKECLRSSGKNDLLEHNLAVFRDGENALQVWPPLIEFIPETRMNLVVHYLKHGKYLEAHELVKNTQPQVPHEYIIKAITLTYLFQETDKLRSFQENAAYKEKAMQFFIAVGSSASECDTIPGRQCMATKLFLEGSFKDANIYFNSIREYLFDDDAFNWNYGMSMAASGNFKEAEELLLLVKNEKWRSEYFYLNWLVRCYVANGKAQKAWELYLDSDDSEDSFDMLLLLANESYLRGSFFHAAKAFDLLGRLDDTKEAFWEGKRGACIGVFQQVVAGLEPQDMLQDVVELLARDKSDRPQVDFILRVIKKWQGETIVAKMQQIQPPVLDSSNDSFLS